MTRNSAFVIGTDPASTGQLMQALTRVNPFLHLQVATIQQAQDQMESLLNQVRPCMVFLSSDDLQSAGAISLLIRRINRNIQVAAFSRSAPGDDLIHLMRTGVKEWLPFPVEDNLLKEALDRMRWELEQCPVAGHELGHLLSFIPAKPGSGASTVAMHVAHACAAGLGKRIALLDLDLNCGIQAFMARVEDGLSVLDAAQYAEQLDDVIWQRMVTSKGEVDLLRSGSLLPGRRIESPQLHRLLGFAESRYALTVLDHSGNWERYSIDALARSSLIFQVCTTDLASLHLARRNIDALQEMELYDRVQVIVNRATYHTGLDRRSVESILGMKPLVCLPNAFGTLQQAVKEATQAGPNTAYGQEIAKLRREILKDAVAGSADEDSRVNARRPIWKFEAVKSAMESLRSRNARPTTSIARAK